MCSSQFPSDPLPIAQSVASAKGWDGATRAMMLAAKQLPILPEALRNYLVRLGWSHGDQEIFSLDEMIAYFDIEHVNRSASAFDMDKLTWFNQYYIKEADAARLMLLLGQRLQESGVDFRTGPDLADVIEISSDEVVHANYLMPPVQEEIA